MITLSTVAAAILATAGLWVLVAGLTEAITEILKTLFPDKVQGKVTYAVSILIGIGLAFAFSLNPFGLVGAAGYASTVAAGLLASRGANYLSGLLKKLGIVAKDKE